MILVTGASGKTGRAVLTALSSAGARTRALVRTQSQAEAILALGADEARVADMRQRGDVEPAVQGVRAVYHICPNVHPAEVEIGQTVIAAARAAGVELVVLHSVLHPQTEELPHHWNKLRVEEALLCSGVAFTILQPAPYLQNLLGTWDLVLSEGILRNPYPLDTRLSLVDVDDVAQVAVRVLTEPAHVAATYELAGTLPLRQDEVAALLSRGLGRPVRAEAESLEAWAERAESAGVGQPAREILSRMFQFYARYGLHGNPALLRWLLGREPTSIEAFARRHAPASLA
jgi:uncharacterized protein YbjT (DUF2867 family)